VLAGFFYGFAHFIKEALHALPEIAQNAIPRIIDYATKQGVDLPFHDVDSLKTLVLASLTDQLRHLGNFARIATKEFAFLIIGAVVSVSLFLTPRFERGDPVRLGRNLYAQFCDELTERFASFFRSFERVMGAQLIISGINTVLTSIFVLSVGLPNPVVVIVLTFLSGLLPVVGNLISNSVIVCIAFTRSPELAFACLAFLVVIHKLEYFLNSKIIGDRIKNPVWLTLLALILGERLMGIPGMILAPVVLHFIKVEASRLPPWTDSENTPAPPPEVEQSLTR
jgi:predicted PurR-regulated permease PerM